MVCIVNHPVPSFLVVERTSQKMWDASDQRAWSWIWNHVKSYSKLRVIKKRNVKSIMFSLTFFARYNIFFSFLYRPVQGWNSIVCGALVVIGMFKMLFHFFLSIGFQRKTIHRRWRRLLSASTVFQWLLSIQYSFSLQFCLYLIARGIWICCNTNISRKLWRRWKNWEERKWLLLRKKGFEDNSVVIAR